MRIKILRQAKEDIALARDFYDAQELGVGDYFLSQITAEIDSLSYLAGVHRVVDGFHKMVTRRFPYAIYYRIEGDCVKVYAVLDGRRNPNWIANRFAGC